MRKTILTVSFGTAYPDALAQTLTAIEQALAAAFPGWEVRRAFTSDRIIQKLWQTEGLLIDPVPQAMGRLEAEGFTHVAVQPTFVTQGQEYEKLLAQLAPYRQRMQIAVGMPLLHEKADYAAVAEALPGWLPRPEADEALVLMGHGASHSDNAAYIRMEDMLRARCDRIFVGTVYGAPGLDSVRQKLRENPGIRKVTLAPFMLVVGDHVRNDMIGSWKVALEAAGYRVCCVIQGLGQCPTIRAIFVKHCREAIDKGGRTWVS